MNILITGVNGMLGSVLAARLSGNYQVNGLDIHPTLKKDLNIQYYQADITDIKKLNSLTQKIEPLMIINCASLTNVDACEAEPEKARAINVGGVENLIELCQSSNAHLIQISTDYVFDGTSGPYSENDETNPINHYGKTKLEAELALVESGINWTILRTNVLFSEDLSEKASFVSWVYNNLKNNEKINVVNDQFGNPTFVNHLAYAIEKIIERDAHGIYHYSGRDYLNRFEFALQIADAFELDNRLINKTTTRSLKQMAPRPYKAGLKSDKIEAELEIKTYNLKESLLVIKRAGEADE
ncbi:MAG: dTDP-4-dehydrorhamnose reductase [Fidelibacterota bacterium]